MMFINLNRLFCLSGIVLSTAVSAAPLPGAERPAPATEAWPQFRGANAAGRAETNAHPPLKFSPTENVGWKLDVPYSPSSPCISGRHLFLTTFAEGQLETRAYDRTAGKLLWIRKAGLEKLEEFHATEGSPAASTPATDGERVVVYFGSGLLVAYDFNGRELWRVSLPMAQTASGFGSGTSPIILGDLVILNRDQVEGSVLLAFDLATGHERWRTLRPGSLTSFGTPILWAHDGISEIVVGGALTLKAYDPATGTERWRVRGLPSFPCTTPVLGSGLLFFAGWSPGKSDSPWPSWASNVEKLDKNGDGKISLGEFGGGVEWFKTQDIDHDGFITEQDWNVMGGMMKAGENQLLAIKPGGSGDVTDTHVVWKATRGLPYVPSPMYADGRVYLVKDGGLASCFEATTGKVIYQQERLGTIGSYYASPIWADGRVYVSSLDGKVTVYRAGGDKPEVLYQADFGERICASVAPVGDTLYVRTKSHLYAFRDVSGSLKNRD